MSERYRLITSLNEISAHLMNFLNAYILISASHYTENFEYGILINQALAYITYPDLKTVDILFGILLVTISLGIIMSRYYIRLDDNRGVYLAIICNAVILLWTLIYPLIVKLITGIISPVSVFFIVQASVFAVISVTLSILMLKENYII